jgi:hypothetical protein
MSEVKKCGRLKKSFAKKKLFNFEKSLNFLLSFQIIFLCMLIRHFSYINHEEKLCLARRTHLNYDDIEKQRQVRSSFTPQCGWWENKKIEVINVCINNSQNHKQSFEVFERVLIMALGDNYKVVPYCCVCKCLDMRWEHFNMEIFLFTKAFLPAAILIHKKLLRGRKRFNSQFIYIPLDIFAKQHAYRSDLNSNLMVQK